MLVIWIRKYNQTHSHTAAGMVRWSWQTAVEQIGEQAAIEAVNQAGLELPKFIDNPMTVAESVVIP